MLEATGTARTAKSTSIQECAALVRDGKWNQVTAPLKQEILADSEALVEMHRAVWAMRSVHLMAQDRLCVQLEPSVAAILTSDSSE